MNKMCVDLLTRMRDFMVSTVQHFDSDHLSINQYVQWFDIFPLRCSLNYIFHTGGTNSSSIDLQNNNLSTTESPAVRNVELISSISKYCHKKDHPGVISVGSFFYFLLYRITSPFGIYISSFFLNCNYLLIHLKWENVSKTLREEERRAHIVAKTKFKAIKPFTGLQ